MRICHEDFDDGISKGASTSLFHLLPSLSRNPRFRPYLTEGVSCPPSGSLGYINFCFQTLGRYIPPPEKTGCSAFQFWPHEPNKEPNIQDDGSIRRMKKKLRDHRHTEWPKALIRLEG